MDSEKGLAPQAGDKPEKGRRVCAWCKKYLGEWEGEGETHGMCEECFRRELKKENITPEDIEK